MGTLPWQQGKRSQLYIGRSESKGPASDQTPSGKLSKGRVGELPNVWKWIAVCT